MSNMFNQTFQNGAFHMIELAKKHGLKFDESLYQFTVEVIAATNIPPVRDEDAHAKLDVLLDKINEMMGGDAVTLDEAMEIGQFKKCISAKKAVRKFLSQNNMLAHTPGQKETWVKRIADQSAAN